MGTRSDIRDSTDTQWKEYEAHEGHHRTDPYSHNDQTKSNNNLRNHFEEEIISGLPDGLCSSIDDFLLLAVLYSYMVIDREIEHFFHRAHEKICPVMMLIVQERECKDISYDHR